MRFILFLLGIGSIYASQPKIHFFVKSGGTLRENSSLAKHFPIAVASKAIDQYQIAQKLAFNIQLAREGFTKDKRQKLIDAKPTRSIIVEVHNKWFKNKRPTTYMKGVGKRSVIYKDGTKQSIQGYPLILLKKSHSHHSGLVHETGHAIMNALYQGKNLPSGCGSHSYNKA